MDVRIIRNPNVEKFHDILDTLPESNIAPENGWLEYYGWCFLLGWPIFRGYVSFREDIIHCYSKESCFFTLQEVLGVDESSFG